MSPIGDPPERNQASCPFMQSCGPAGSAASSSSPIGTNRHRPRALSLPGTRVRWSVPGSFNEGELRFCEGSPLRRRDCSLDQGLNDAEECVRPFAYRGRSVRQGRRFGKAPTKAFEVLAGGEDQDALEWHAPALPVLLDRNPVESAQPRHRGPTDPSELGRILNGYPRRFCLFDGIASGGLFFAG